MVNDDTLRHCPACEGALPLTARFCPACGFDTDTQSDTVIEPGAHGLAVRHGGDVLPPMRLPPGTRISVYRIESVIGEGGMGVVYRAFDEALNRPVAIKCLHTNLAGDAEIRRRFAREARILRDCVHPNIVSVFDFVEHDYLLGIVMELVDGASLVHHLAKWRARMPLFEIREVFCGVLEAVEEGHRRGVIHRDLKPDNILVTSVGGALRPKIVDFGIAKILEGTTYTMTGAFLGTGCYMSPEQVQHPNATDRRSDIYSLGITLYQICTGKLPFEGDHFSVMMAHVNQAPRPPSELRPDLPPALERLILDALAKNPASRPPSCADFQQRLEAALAGVASNAPPSTEPLPAQLKGSAGEDMLLIPAGPFRMGKDRRSVYLDAFYVDKTPVTNREFATFVDVTGYRPSDTEASRFLNHLPHRKIPKGHEQHPVVYVSWEDARCYAIWAGKRLPTEAEWEKAARGVDGRKYPWGRTEPTPKKANYDNKDGGTAPVGSFPEGASPYGVLDLAGNVWEWCDDYDDPAFYEHGPPHNPRNTQSGDKALRVMRGGSYLYGSRALRTYSRVSFEAHYRFGGGGFRCARGT